MSFGLPVMFYLFLLLAPLFALLILGERKRRRIARIFGSVSVPSWGFALRLVLISVFIGSLVVVAARPHDIIVAPRLGKTGNYLFLVDVSRSMEGRYDCSDPTKLDRAKQFMRSTLTGVPEGRFGVSAFGKLTFILTQLTYDHQYLREVIENGLFIGVVPVERPGSQIGNALEVLARKKKALPEVYGNLEYVVFITDGDMRGDYEEQLRQPVLRLRDAGIKVIAVGVGDIEGTPVPVKDSEGNCTSELEKVRGQTFYSYLREDVLRFIAKETKGAYFAETEQEDLVRFLRGTLADSANRPELVEQTRDLSWIFLIPATLALFGLFVLGAKRY